LTDQAAQRNWAGDVWGGSAAMLVALPSAIAFGVTIFSPLGGSYAAQGALAGILGATALGLIAPAFGGTSRLITAPCAPAAAVLAALAATFAQQGMPGDAAVLMLILIGLLAGAMQIGLGLAGVGRLIKYIPYPVVSGYLSGVGLIIIGSQVPKLLGAPKGMNLWQALTAPQQWLWQGIVVGLVVLAGMVLAPRITRTVPAAIQALLLGVMTYFGLGFIDASLLRLEGNPFIIGPLGGAGGSVLDGISQHWHALGAFNAAMLAQVAIPALTLAVLLSIDTLKTCVVLDALTRSHHDSNRELVGQGLANVGSAVVGGVPGAGTMGASLVNISSGAQTRMSGMVEGGLALAAFLLLAGLIAWVPIAALAAILIFIGFRMIDWHSFEFIRTPSTRFDFLVIATVIGVALSVNLIAASGAGVALAILLFLREQTRSSVLRQKTEGSEIFSRVIRHESEMEILSSHGEKTVIVELQGSLFFGTANQLYQVLEPEIGLRRYVILNLRRVQSLDLTATHVLEQIKDQLEETGAYLIFTEIPKGLPSGLKMKKYLKEVGLVRDTSKAMAFRELDEALEWVEEKILEEAGGAGAEEETLLELGELELFHGRKPETLAALEACMEQRHVKAGKKIFKAGEEGDQLMLIRRGVVRVTLPIRKKQVHHVGTFERGSFIGELGFLTGVPRTADAVAVTDTDLYVLPRASFDALAQEHRVAALQLIEGIAHSLAMRLRYANAELRALRS
jgi:SulP family sulfate permease